jgi:hypothetical protein
LGGGLHFLPLWCYLWIKEVVFPTLINIAMAGPGFYSRTPKKIRYNNKELSNMPTSRKSPVVEKGSLRFTFPDALYKAFTASSPFVIDIHPNGLRRIDSALLEKAEFIRELAKQVEAGNVEVIVRAVSE